MTVVRITCERLCSFLHDAETRHDIKHTQQGIQSDLPPNCRKKHRQVTPPETLSPGKEAEIAECEAEEAAKSEARDPEWKWPTSAIDTCPIEAHSDASPTRLSRTSKSSCNGDHRHTFALQPSYLRRLITNLTTKVQSVQRRTANEHQGGLVPCACCKRKIPSEKVTCISTLICFAATMYFQWMVVPFVCASWFCIFKLQSTLCLGSWPNISSTSEESPRSIGYWRLFDCTLPIITSLISSIFYLPNVRKSLLLDMPSTEVCL